MNMIQINNNILLISLLTTMKAISASQQQRIFSLLDSGKSTRQISSTTGIPLSTISRYCQKHRPNLPKSSGGRPSKLTEANVKYAHRLICSGKIDTAVQATKILKTVTNQPISAETVRQHLKKIGMKAVVKAKKPCLEPRHRRERLHFAHRHKDWTVEDWKRVIWSDETKINRKGSDGRKWVWKNKGEGISNRTVQGTVKFGGGSVMIWGCMLWDGPGRLCRIEGMMNGAFYTTILDDELQGTIKDYKKKVTKVIFQQDNDPKHTSKLAEDWFKKHKMEVLIWPAQSPDLNPIEHLWSHLKRRLAEYEVEPKGVFELWERVKEEWAKIEPSVCQGLIESMPRRIEAVLKAKGGHTKY